MGCLDSSLWCSRLQNKILPMYYLDYVPTIKNLARILFFVAFPKSSCKQAYNCCALRLLGDALINTIMLDVVAL